MEKEKTVGIYIRIPESLHKRLKSVTEITNRSIKKECIMAVRHWVNTFEHDPNKGQGMGEVPPRGETGGDPSLQHMPKMLEVICR